MKFAVLAGLAIVIGFSSAAHAGCARPACPPDQQPTTAQQATEVTLERRIENALKDLEIANARASIAGRQGTNAKLERRIENALEDLESATVRAFKADRERLNELARKAGIDR
jgi:polyhydroxyalkanoate synthesis regulator phasin